MTTFDMRALVLEQAKAATNYEGNVNVTKAYTIAVDFPESSEKADLPGYSWIREYGVNGAVSWAFNPYVSNRVDVPVLVKKSPKPPFTRLILGVDWDTVITMPDFGGGDLLMPEHAQMHEWPDYTPGADVVTVHQRAMAPLRVTVGSAAQSITVAPYRYIRGSIVVSYAGVYNVDISSYYPTSGNKRTLLVYLDPRTTTLMFATGDEVPEVDTITTPYPILPLGMVHSALIELHSSTIVMVESDILDIRQAIKATDGQQFSATRVGEILMSMDGETFTAQLPLIDTETGTIVIDSYDGTIVVEG